MEILCKFVDPLEDLRDPPLVFVLQNPLPRRPLQHFVEFGHVVNDYPA